MPRMHILSAVEQDRFERPQTFDSVAGHHQNTLAAVMGQFQHVRRVRFFGREASGYDRRSSPQKADRNHPRKSGGAKSMIYTPFQ